MAEHVNSPQSRVLRVFLSSTFRDFMQERDRLVKQVFPELRRKARERGVEVVEVDLRWGITEEESRQGKVLPICLAEINRCRPYFVGMLGERYGWVPPADEDNRVVLTDEAWVEEHLGRRSVTELEILHGVLNNPEMAGRAFFYFRDPAWSQAQTEPGFVCDSTEEAEKLADLKQRILASGLPVVRERDLPNPEALADRIGIDLWALIEEQFPELDQPDALEREERKHASYRRSRTELYEDGGSRGSKVSQLEQWIAAGEQRILITGESGSGKSALIANWMQRHQQSHPDDVVFAHHLGCSNDANALEPMLARMVQTASKLMADELSEPIKVPQDYWELVSTVTDTLGKLSFWCKQQGRRWIWVLDGLDRLPEENQQALPWLPLQLFPQLHVVISALDSPARTILQEREYTTLTIGPLEELEQKALIQATMRRYNKTLIPELEAKILEHEPARSPLFLRVVLDELRLCGRHETLAQQLDDYLNAQSVDALYAKVLERLEADVGREVVEKVMQAIWASRAGLSEPELQAITGVAPLQWAPIDLGLEGSFGRNSNRLVFDHEYLRQAVKERYLPTEQEQRNAHSGLADWFNYQDDWNERDSEELPWQLKESSRIDDLRELLLTPRAIAIVHYHRGSRETVELWRVAKEAGNGELDELINERVEREIIELRGKDPVLLSAVVDNLASLFDEAGLYRDGLLRLRKLSVELEDELAIDVNRVSAKLGWLAQAFMRVGNYDASLDLFEQQLDAQERFLGPEHPDTLSSVGYIASLYQDKGDYENAEKFFYRALEVNKKRLGPEHPTTLRTYANIGLLFYCRGKHEQAETSLMQTLEALERVVGGEHIDSIAVLNNLGIVFCAKGDYKQAETCLKRCLEVRNRLLGLDHPETITTANNLATLLREKGDYEQAEKYSKRCLETRERLLGPDHPDTLVSANDLGLLLIYQAKYESAERWLLQALETRMGMFGPEHASTLTTMSNLGILYDAKGDYEQAEDMYNRCLESSNRHLGGEHPHVLTTINNLATLYRNKGDLDRAAQLLQQALGDCESLLGLGHPISIKIITNLGTIFADLGLAKKAETLLEQALEAQELRLGPGHPDTVNTINSLGSHYGDQGKYEEAELLLRRALETREHLLGPSHHSTLTTVANLGFLYQDMGAYEKAEAFLNRALEGFERLLGAKHPNTNDIRYSLANLFSDQERYEESILLRRLELEVAIMRGGREAEDTLSSIHRLAEDLYWNDEFQESEQLYREALARRVTALGDNDHATMASRHGLARCLSRMKRYDEAIELRRNYIAWSCQANGDNDPSTLASINELAIDLRQSGHLNEAETLFRELFSSQLQVLDPSDFQIGRALGGLSKTLELAEKLEEALSFAQQALDHRFKHEGPDAWWTNRERLDLGRLLVKAGKHPEAHANLTTLSKSMALVEDPDDQDLMLIDEASALLQTLQYYT